MSRPYAFLEGIGRRLAARAAALSAAAMLFAAAPALAQDLILGVDVGSARFDVGNPDGELARGTTQFPVFGGLLGFTYAGDQDEDLGWSFDFRMAIHSVALDLDDGRKTNLLENILGDFTMSEGFMVRVKNAAGGLFLDHRVISRGDSFVDLGTTPMFGNMLTGIGYVGKASFGGTRMAQVQLQYVDYFAGDMAWGTEPGVALEKGRELRFSGAYMFRTTKGIRVELVDTQLDFEPRLFNANGRYDHRGTTFTTGLVFILF